MGVARSDRTSYGTRPQVRRWSSTGERQTIVYHSLCYGAVMASRTVRARLDPKAVSDLELLLREGGTESDAVRSALAEAAARRRRRSTLRAEVARLAADPDDRRARQEALSDLDQLEAPWPS